MTIQPIFVFSITRSGSTLVQRVIAAHDGVATASEPWLLLPYLYTMRDRGVVAEYTHPLMREAIDDFCDILPNGRSDYYQELHDFIIRLYSKAAGQDARYFLDKSPPYYFIVDDIIRLFPEGKFIFLWRNPLSILASIIETWQHGQWSVTEFREDLFIGLPKLIAAYRANYTQVHSVRLEDLLADGDEQWRALMGYLDIPFDPQALQRFRDVKLSGRMGDPTGVKRYTRIDSEPIDKWKATLVNPLRRAWAGRYLRFLGEDRLATIGYSANDLMRALDAQPARGTLLLSDLGRLSTDLLMEPARAYVRRKGVGGPSSIRELLSV
jgi:Sulfotransferase family